MPLQFPNPPNPIDERTPVDEHIKERCGKARTGGGKIPPVNLPPVGGNDDGGPDDWREKRSGPKSNLKIIRLALISAMAGDLMALSALIGVFFVSHSSHHWDRFGAALVPDWYPIELPPILYLNTALLLLSALTVEVARRRIFREMDVMDEWLGLGTPALKRSLPWLGVTLFLGMLFLAGQLEAWRQLVSHGVTFFKHVTPAANTFYILTGFQMLHLIFGILAIIAGGFLLPRLRRVEFRQILVDAASWFWIWICGMWMVIFGLLVLGN